jgi:hypothetical protein
MVDKVDRHTQGLRPGGDQRTRIAEVLSRKRGLSVGMIRRLHERLGISAQVLIWPKKCAVSRPRSLAKRLIVTISMTCLRV